MRASDVRRQQTQSVEGISSTFLIMSILGVLFVLGIVFFFVIIPKSFHRDDLPDKQMSNMMDRLDADVPTDTGIDEIDNMGKDINETVHSIRSK